ncbi:NAD(P)-dependent oxidoreductase [Methylomonas sp. AM2-LC]|uniref:NAD-dependent epimerase/dehydratase family protein n=1 Tax=Methylomonas sp. AM2-LC TaxID=3153301 RepID=UPI0032666189
MKLLITGATGFVGKQLVYAALACGYDVVAMFRGNALSSLACHENLELMKCDLSVDEIPPLSTFKIDCVVHLAADLHPAKNQSIEQLLIGTEKLITAMQLAGITKLVGVSSLSVLDYQALKPMTSIDENLSVATQFDKMSRYSAFKSSQEAVFRAFSEQGANCIILRPGLIYNQNMINTAYAGIIKSRYQILIDHLGEVPLVELGSVIDAILASVTLDSCNQQVIHLVDDHLPNQTQYQALLRQVGLIKPGGIRVSWWIMQVLIVHILYPMAKLLRFDGCLPEIFLPHAFALRLKPFKFSNLKAKQLLHWKANRLL